MSVAFVMWAMHTFDNCDFIMAGQSVGSLERNVVIKLIGILKNSQQIKFGVKTNVSKHYFDVYYLNRHNRFYCFGGSDADSYEGVQGLTAAGAYFDEITLLNEEFINQSTARCTAHNGDKYAKFWMNCNPRHPLHWFKTNWIDEAKNKKALIVDFKMEDNPSNTPQILDAYKIRYRGVFHKRYIDGQWAAGEGVIYENWRSDDFNWQRMLQKKDAQRRDKYIKVCGLDFGYNHPLAVVASMYDRETNTLYVYKEISQRGLRIQEIYNEIKKAGLHKEQIMADSEDPRMIRELSDLGLYVSSVNKGSVISGIQKLQNMNIVVHPACINVLNGFNSYSWKNDKKTGRATDEPVKENDDEMDALRYSIIDIDSGFKFA